MKTKEMSVKNSNGDNLDIPRRQVTEKVILMRRHSDIPANISEAMNWQPGYG
jgi:hypothetical protein